MFEEKVKILNREIIKYGALVEQMIEKSIKSLINDDADIARQVINKDEEKANRLELEIEESCVNTIALYEPKAKLLRLILMILKINNDFERMGDHAVNIAQSARDIAGEKRVKHLKDIPEMANETIKMLKDSTTAFINEDPDLAKAVCERDNVVDNLKDKIYRELMTVMAKDSDNIEQALHLMRISSNLERIADLSTNICEDVIFIVKGEVIKHGSDE